MAIAICVLLLTVLMKTVTNAGFVGAYSSVGSPLYDSAQALTSQSKGPFRTPSFPPLPWISNLPFPKFPTFPTFPPVNTMKPLDVQGIATQFEETGNNFKSVAGVVHQATTKLKDGRVGTTGGSTVVFDDNGKYIVQQTGDARPVVTITQFKNPSFADFHQPEFEQFNDDIKKPDLDFPTIESITFKPIDDDVLKTYVPRSNEKFKGSVYSINTFSSDVNGVKNSGGEATFLNNNNGKVDVKRIVF